MTGQGAAVLAVLLNIFSPAYYLVYEKAQYKLKYCSSEPDSVYEIFLPKLYSLQKIPVIERELLQQQFYTTFVKISEVI